VNDERQHARSVRAGRGCDGNVIWGYRQRGFRRNARFRSILTIQLRED
jgi:hypothetical protein